LLPVPVREATGLALHAVPAEGQDLAVLATQDGGHGATLRPETATGRRIAGDVAPMLRRGLDEAALAAAAYLLGVMERSFAMTLDYLRTRQQFGRPIGSFQALQHRAGSAHPDHPDAGERGGGGGDAGCRRW